MTDFAELREPVEVYQAALGNLSPLVERLQSDAAILSWEKAALAALIQRELTPPYLRSVDAVYDKRTALMRNFLTDKKLGPTPSTRQLLERKMDQFFPFLRYFDRKHILMRGVLSYRKIMNAGRTSGPQKTLARDALERVTTDTNAELQQHGFDPVSEDTMNVKIRRGTKPILKSRMGLTHRSPSHDVSTAFLEWCYRHPDQVRQYWERKQATSSPLL